MQSQRDRAEALARALSALGRGEQAEAAALARDLLHRWPDDASVLQLMAAIAWRRSEPVQAERWAVASLAVRPDHAATWVLAAVAARAQGQWRTALERYRRAAALEPSRAEAAFGAAVAAIALDPAQAPEVFSMLRQGFPAPSLAWAELGGACERGGRWELAAEAFRLALQAQPSPQLHLRFGAALQAVGRRGEAAAAFQAALQLDPASAEAWFKLGLVFQDSRDPARAEAAYRQALALRPNLAEAHVNLGVVLQEQGDLAAAKRAYGRAVDIMPSAFGRVAQALTTAPAGELWLDLAELRDHLSELGRLSR